MDKALSDYMASNPVLLYSHKKSLPPVGKVLRAHVDRAKGIFIEAVMPRPRDGTFLAEVYEAAKLGLLKALSIGGSWKRSYAKGYPEIIGADLQEISLASLGINPETTISDPLSVQGVKAVGDLWVPNLSDRLDYAQHRSMESDLAALQAAVALAEIGQLREPNFYDGY